MEIRVVKTHEINEMLAYLLGIKLDDISLNIGSAEA